MQLYDISQEIFTCAVYPGDPAPAREVLSNMDRGDLYNLTAFSMCAHNGTHVDAPTHFLADSDTVDKLPLSKTVGDCVVISHTGDVTAADAARMLQIAGNCKKLLVKGDATLTMEGAQVLADMVNMAKGKQQVESDREEPEETEEDQQAVEDTAYFQSRQRIMEMLSGLSQQEAMLLSLRFGLEGGLPLTPEQAGAKLGLTPQEVVAMEAAALEKLRKEQ